MCGSTYKLEFHHVEPKAPQERNGGKGNLLHVREVVREGGKVWLLCFRCHTLIDPDRKQFYPGDIQCENTNAMNVEKSSISKSEKETMNAIQR
jgi:hypothetical protein